MKYFLIAVFVLCGCSSDNPCAPIKKSDYKDGLISSRKLGEVNIDGDKCQIFEQFQYQSCHVVADYNKCDGEYVSCYEKILTRVTKCPGGNVVNTITYSGDKFHIEQVK